MAEEIEETTVDPANTCLITLTISEDDYDAIKLIRSCFGEQDKHSVCSVLDKIIEQYLNNKLC